MLSTLRRKRLIEELTIYDIELETGIDRGRLSLIERGYTKVIYRGVLPSLFDWPYGEVIDYAGKGDLGR